VARLLLRLTIGPNCICAQGAQAASWEDRILSKADMFLYSVRFLPVIAASLCLAVTTPDAATFQDVAPGLSALAECRDRASVHAGLDVFRDRMKTVNAISCEYREQRGARVLECNLPAAITVFGAEASRIEFSESQGSRRVVTLVSGVPGNFIRQVETKLGLRPDSGKYPAEFALNRSADGSKDFILGVLPTGIAPRQVTCSLGAGAAASYVAALLKPGSISGKLSYPSEFLPPMRVCAIAVDGASRFGCVSTRENQRAYRIDNLAPATYYVLAYVKDGGVHSTGAFTRAVRCGVGQPRCTDGSLIPVTLGEGNSITGVDPGDFYSASGGWPKEPAQDRE
jgi:hypothetical protein